MPPILLLQFRLFYHEGKPAAVVLYAFVSEEVERRLEAGAPSLRPRRLEVRRASMDRASHCPFRPSRRFAKETCETVLKGRDVKMQLHKAISALCMRSCRSSR